MPAPTPQPPADPRDQPTPDPDPADGSDTATASPYPSPARQLALQGGAIFLVLCIAVPTFGLGSAPWPWGGIALTIGATSLGLAFLSRQPWWWKLIHALFFPLAWQVSRLGIDPGWFLFAAIALLLVYRGALTGQVPLFLSNRATVAALAEALPDGARVTDLGAGIGSVVFPLAARRPDLRLCGVENAPLPWGLGRLRHACFPRKCQVDWRYGSLWEAHLGQTDVVYAFLSPAPMAALWEKLQAELPAGGWLVSNSFPVPGVAPEREVEAGGRRLYFYRTPQA